jgi:hypothetical protein
MPAVLTALPAELLVQIMLHVDGADLGRLAQVSTGLRALLSRRAEPWRAALARIGASSAPAAGAAGARRSFVMLHCRSPPEGARARCPGCGQHIAAWEGGAAALRTLPMCQFLGSARAVGAS